jgi:stalled ribosome rescue protein Dom34
LLAYETEAAANNRYLICGSKFVYQDILNFIRAKYPELKDTTPEGHPDATLDIMTLDVSKSKKELGMTYRTFEQTIGDTVDSLRALEKKVAA